MPAEFYTPRGVMLEQRKRALKPSLELFQRALEGRKFITARTPEDANALLPIFTQKAQELKKALSAKESEGTFEETLRNKPQEVRKIMRSSYRRELEGYAESKASTKLSNALQNAAMMAMWGEVNKEDIEYIPEEVFEIVNGIKFKSSMYLKWQTISDLPELVNTPNPWAPIIDLTFVGGVNVRFQGNTLRADLPLILPDNKRALGCWKEGQTELVIAHPWTAICADSLSQFAI